MTRRIVVVIADGVTDSGLSIALDVFRAANTLAHRASPGQVPFRIEVASANGGPIRAASGLVFQATRAVARLGTCDVLLTPGFWVEDAGEIDAILARDDIKKLVVALARGHANGAIVGASCTGTFLLAEAGLLDGRACTTAWWLAPLLRARRPETEVDADAALVVQGRVLTAGAVFAQADLALHLVAHFAGPSLAEQCARVLLLDTHSSQAAYMAVQYLSASDPTAERAERWLRGHLSGDVTVPRLARHLGLSARTLARRLQKALGVSPVRLIRRVRADAASHLLATTKLSLEEVAQRVGYADANSLARLLRQEKRRAPRQIRERPFS